jgi:hypothetical protein
MAERRFIYPAFPKFIIGLSHIFAPPTSRRFRLIAGHFRAFFSLKYARRRQDSALPPHRE